MTTAHVKKKTLNLYMSSGCVVPVTQPIQIQIVQPKHFL